MIADLLGQIGVIALCATPAAFLIFILVGLEAMREFWENQQDEWRDERIAERLGREFRLGKCEQLDEHKLAERRR